MQSESQLRRLFTTTLAFCFPSEPRVLWNLFKDVICDDLKHHLQTTYHIQNPEDDQVYNFGLYLIDKILNRLECLWISLEIYLRLQVTGRKLSEIGLWQNREYIIHLLNWQGPLKILPGLIQDRNWSMIRFWLQS